MLEVDRVDDQILAFAGGGGKRDLFLRCAKHRGVGAADLIRLYQHFTHGEGASRLRRDPLAGGVDDHMRDQTRVGRIEEGVVPKRGELVRTPSGSSVVGVRWSDATAAVAVAPRKFRRVRSMASRF
jgi:hypothetical protein